MQAADSAVLDLVRAADAAFAAGDPEHYAELFADDARLLILHRQQVDGRDAIRDFWRQAFTRFDTSAWDAQLELVEMHHERAYALATYTERLLNRTDGSRTLVRGRLVYFMRRDGDGAWRISLLMNSHSHPLEPIP